MAYGALVDNSYQNQKGETCRVLIEREGYSGTTYSPRIYGHDINHGGQNDDLTRKRTSIIGTADLHVAEDSSTLMDELRKISRNASRQHRVTIERAGTVRLKGYVVPDATTTPRHDTRAGVVTVRAKDRLKGLSADWTDANGDRFSGDKVASVMIADILGRLGLSLPLRAVLNVRPSSMDSTDDPLSIQVPTDAFYRTGSGGTVRAMKAGEVLDDLLVTLGMEIVQKDGLWKLHRPGAFTTAQTDANDEVTVWRYDSNGTLLATNTEKRTAAVVTTEEAWIKGSGEVSGEEQVIDARIIYEHGAPDDIDFNGSFEDLGLNPPLFKGWTWSGASADINENFFNYSDGGERACELNGVETNDCATLKITATETLTTGLGVATKDAMEPFDLTLRVLRREGTADQYDQLAAFWSIKLTTDGGSTEYWDEANSSWSGSEVKNTLNDQMDDRGRDSWYQETFQITAPPRSGTLELIIWEPVACPVKSTPDPKLVFDAFLYERSANADAVTTYRAHDPTKEEGETVEHTVRIGEGPWEGSKGALLDDQGNTAAEWSLVGSSTTHTLSALTARQVIALRSRPQQIDTFELIHPETEPQIDRALDYDGTRYWPLSIQESQAKDRYIVRAVELLENVPADVEVEVFPGDGDVSSSPTGSDSDGTSSTSWNDVSSKPFDTLDNDLLENSNGALTIVGTSIGTTELAAGAVTNAKLANDTVTVAGNAVALGGSTAVAHADLSSIGPDQHHAQDHNTRHALNGADELKLSNLSASNGTSGQFLQSDGTAATWSDLPVVDHSLSEHTDASIGAPTTEKGHLIFNTGSSWGSDQTPSPPSDGQVPQWDNANSRWAYVNGGVDVLADLSDVSGAGQTDGHVLASGGADYRNEAISSLTADHVALTDLSSHTHAELSTAPADAHHPEDHFQRHAWDGADALDAGNLSGASGTADQVLTTDGSKANWTTTSAEPHSLNEHTDSTIGTPTTEAGHLVYTDGSDWSSDQSISPPSDNQVPKWDATNSRYIFSGTVPDANQLNGVAASNYARTDADTTINGATWTFNIAPDQIQFTSDANARNFAIIDEGGTNKWNLLYRGDLSTEGIEFEDLGGGNSVLYLDRTNQRIGAGGITSPSYSVHSSGDIASDTALRDLSDARYKTDITPIEDPLDVVMGAGGYTYYRTDQDIGLQGGVVAQDFEGAYDVAVEERKDKKTVDMGALHGLTFAALKELVHEYREERDRLRERIDTLEQKV